VDAERFDVDDVVQRVAGRQQHRWAEFLAHRAAVVAVADSQSDVNPTIATDATPRLLKASEVAERWGLHRATIYRLAQRGELPAIQIGGSIRFDSREVARWLYSDTPRDAA
jgi:excisionase family DNA binding protein